MSKALMITGGWDGHQPEQCADIFARWLRGMGWEVLVSNTLDVLLDAKAMAGLSVIVPAWTMGKISEEQSKAIRDAVLGGVGIAGWHGGMCDAFREDTGYQFMTGGQWVAHPGGIIKYRVNVKQDTDGFMTGLKDFDMESEQYYMHTDPGNEVLATSTITGEFGDCPWIAGTIMPMAWKRMYGKGRVFYSALGHVASDFNVPEVAEITRRGILWAARK